MNIAVIVETRIQENIQEVIEGHMKFLPGWEMDWWKDVPMNSPYDYNNLLTSPDFWLKYKDYEKVLIFQHDSAILREGIDEFMGWDYVGAPWKPDAPWARKDRKGGNGGFSLRNPRAMLKLLYKMPYKHYQDLGYQGNEDVHFVRFLHNVDAKIAPYEVCKLFSCESIFELGTFGCHAIESHLNPGQCEQIRNQYIHEKQE